MQAADLVHQSLYNYLRLTCFMVCFNLRSVRAASIFQLLSPPEVSITKNVGLKAMLVAQLLF